MACIKILGYKIKISFRDRAVDLYYTFDHMYQERWGIQGANDVTCARRASGQTQTGGRCCI